MERADLVEPPFVGESRHKIVDGLVDLLIDAQSNERAMWISIEAPSGWGKTRVAHAFYERLAAAQDKRYWPPTILETTDATLHDVSSRRKRVFPEVSPVLQNREAGALPEFFWWGIACDMRNGVPTQVLQQDLEQLEAHSLFLEAAWSALAKADAKHDISLEKARELATKVAEEALGEGIGLLAERLLGASLPGLGLAIDLAKLGFGKAQDRLERRRIIAEAGKRPEETKSDIVDEAAGTLKRIARPRLPVIVFIEDLHRDDGLVSRMLDSLVRANAPILILTTAWPGEIEQSKRLRTLIGDSVISDRIHRLRHDRPVPETFPPNASMDALSQEALKDIIRSYYPATSNFVLDHLSARYNNPLPIEIICSLPKHRSRSRDGALVLTSEEIDHLPRQVADLYRELWNELDYPVQCALALSTLAIPGSGLSWHRDLVRRALETVSDQIIGPDTGSSRGDDVPHGWVREIETWLRRFNEPDQMRIAREDLDEQSLFGDEVISPFLDTLVAEIARPEFWESKDAPADEAQHLAWLALALRPTGRIDDKLALKAILLLMNALSDKPLEIQRRLSLVSIFEELDIDADSGPALAFRSHAAKALAESGSVAGGIAATGELLADQLRVQGEDHPDVLITRHNLAHWLGEAGQVEAGLVATEALLADQRRILGEDHPYVLTTRNTLAFGLGRAGRVKEALAAIETLLADQRRILGEDHADVLTTRNSLAHWLGEAGKVAEALAELEALLVDQGRILGENHPNVLASRRNQARWLGKTGQLADAVAAIETLLADQQRILGEDHPDVMITRNSLAFWLGEAGRTTEALATIETLLAHRRRLLGEDHPDVLKNRDNLAFCLGKVGQVTEALAVIEALLADERRILGEDHPDVLTTRSSLAHWLGEAGRVAEALTTTEALLADRRRILGEDHPDVLASKGHLILWLGKTGRVEDALAASEALLADQLRMLGDDHPHVLITRSNRTRWLGEAGRAAEALAATEALLADQRRILGEDHPHVLTDRGNLVRWLGEVGRADEALTASEALLADQQRILGNDHPQVLVTRYNLVHWLGENGRVEDALAASEALLADQRRISGEDHPDILNALSGLAHWLGEAGREADALAATETLLTAQLRILGEGHPYLATTRNNLAFWLGKVGRINEAIAAFEALLPDQRRSFGDDHPFVLKVQNRIEQMKATGRFAA